MARFESLTWGGGSRGEDSATFAYDPLSIPNGYHSILQNVEPAAGRMKPRLGCSLVMDGMSAVTWMGEYQEAADGFGLILDAGTLKYKAHSGSSGIIRTNWNVAGNKCSSVRCGKYLIIIADAEGLAMVLYRESGSFKWFDAVMPNPGSPFEGVSARFSTEAGYFDELNIMGPEDSSDPVITTGPFRVDRPRVISYTWVKLAGYANDVLYPSPDMGMPSAMMESYEDVNWRAKASISSWFSRTAIKVNYEGVTGGTKMTLFNPTTPEGNGEIFLKFNSVTNPNGATHLRVYMTLPASSTTSLSDSEKDAAGLALRWACDIPVHKVAETYTNQQISGDGFKLPGSDAYLQGSTNLAWSTGRDDIPPGGFIKFAGGRLWIGGSSAQTRSNDFSANPGRVYASAVMDGATDQLSRLLSFAYQTDYVDTSTDESEQCLGCATSQGNLVFFNPSSVWSLRNADLDYAPVQISNMGAVGCITEINQRIYYLSNEGPAVVSGTVVEQFTDFKSDMTTPGIPDFSEFYRPAKTLTAFFHNDSWILSDGEHAAAYLLRGNDTGTWRIVPATPARFSFQSFPRKDVCWIGGSAFPILSLMDKSAVFDSNTAFLCRVYTNGTIMPKRIECGEVYSISTNSRWVDNGEMKTVVEGDFGRVAEIFTFEETQETGAATLPAKGIRGTVVQGVTAGAFSHWFQCGLEKYVRSSGTLFGEIRLDLIPRNLHAESISVSAPLKPEPILDAGFFGFDPLAENFTEA